jgi:hypothetical protein
MTQISNQANVQGPKVTNMGLDPAEVYGSEAFYKRLKSSALELLKNCDAEDITHKRWCTVCADCPPDFDGKRSTRVDSYFQSFELRPAGGGDPIIRITEDRKQPGCLSTHGEEISIYLKIFQAGEPPFECRGDSELLNAATKRKLEQGRILALRPLEMLAGCIENGILAKGFEQGLSSLQITEERNDPSHTLTITVDPYTLSITKKRMNEILGSTAFEYSGSLQVKHPEQLCAFGLINAAEARLGIDQTDCSSAWNRDKFKNGSLVYKFESLDAARLFEMAHREVPAATPQSIPTADARPQQHAATSSVLRRWLMRDRR